MFMTENIISISYNKTCLTLIYIPYKSMTDLGSKIMGK